MKPPSRFLFFPSLLFVFLVFFWPTDRSGSTVLSKGDTPVTGTLPIQASVKFAAGLTPSPTPDVAGGPPEPRRVTAPAALNGENIHLGKYMGSQVVGLPLVEKAPDLPNLSHSTGLHELIGQVVNGQSRELRGVYVEDVLALSVVQQPAEDYAYVDDLPGTVTQFQSAAQGGVTGLLAHNFLSGERFFNLEVGQEVGLIFGDGVVSRYLITDIQSYQKLAGDLRNSHYLNLESGEKLSTPQLFKRMYTGGDKVTFQTCIKKGNDWSWGRIFIIGVPLPEG